MPAGPFALEAAQASYKEMIKDLDEIGPITQAAFMAKAYGLINSGAAGFEIIPGTFNDDVHPLSKAIFMNNYGVRTVAEESGCLAWNWNAPMWFGVNTINVNGRTTTLFGSSLWGLPLVEAMRDNIEATLREMLVALSKPIAAAERRRMLDRLCAGLRVWRADEWDPGMRRAAPLAAAPLAAAANMPPPRTCRRRAQGATRGARGV